MTWHTNYMSLVKDTDWHSFGYLCVVFKDVFRTWYQTYTMELFVKIVNFFFLTSIKTTQYLSLTINPFKEKIPTAAKVVRLKPLPFLASFISLPKPFGFASTKY